jgi:signal peptidase I
MRFIKNFLRFFQFTLLIFITILALFILNNSFNFVSKYQSFVVQSGSMEPAIMTGDIIIVQSQTEYFVNEVITFNSNDRVITHRIVEKDTQAEPIYYSTKGDANRTGDDDLIKEDQIIGKVILTLPRLGFFVAFSQSRSGLIVMVLIPVIILILDKLIKILNDVRKKS